MGVDQSDLHSIGIQLLDSRNFSLHNETIGCLSDNILILKTDLN